MKFVVIGCGRVGAELAHRLFLNGHQIVVVDKEESAFQNLPVDFRGRTVEGQVLSQDVLRRASLHEADGVAAVTNSDTMNAVIAHIAREEFNVPNIVVRNYNSRWRTTLEMFGLQLVSSTSWGAQRIEELLYQQETRTLYSSGNGEVELYEFTVREAWDGQPLSALVPEKEVVIASLARAGRAIIPSRDMILNTGDVVVISATLEGSQEVHRRLDIHSGSGKEK
jgi:trk system potassium uptake protein TrkA